MRDALRDKGYLTLGSRFKRIGEALQAEAQSLHSAGGSPFTASLCPVLSVLDEAGAMAIKDLAQTLGISQPGVTQIVGKLKKCGWVEDQIDPNDKRVRRAVLSTEGQRRVDEARDHIWPDVEAAVMRTCLPLEGSLLEQLNALEARLAEASFPHRLALTRDAAYAALDRPVWHTLSHRHFALSRGTPRARIFLPEVNAFASAASDDDADMSALVALIEPHRPVYLIQRTPLNLPENLEVLKTAKGVQMVLDGAVAMRDNAPEIVALSEEDIPQMVALAHLTEPGPFFDRTFYMGRWWGIRMNGRLAAMAGERMAFPGFCEVSGVCSHPDFRGQGLAYHLSAYVTAEIRARGQVAFLHSWADNDTAIGLYTRIGFRPRCEMNVAVVQKG
ncbi:GNAT family N-acetyltransferase [Woodsholea maritima]|uniref:GNAT family N-acetyltransferase n=1 Tax=Woodsholea maritima TaxID=240237 RepID=UPI000366EC45|nr:GNAT family N-acetyltransferase [Woodsholea maritima]